MLPLKKQAKGCKLRQHIITVLCYLLRLPFALLNIAQRLFNRRARQHPRSIVVIKPCCLGDLLMTTPLLEVVHNAYPEACITYVAGTWSKVIPEHHPAVNAVIDCASVGIPGRYSLNDYTKLIKTLRRHHFDLAFVLDRSPMMTLLPWLAGIPRRVGPDSLGRGFSLTDRVPVSAHQITCNTRPKSTLTWLAPSVYLSTLPICVLSQLQKNGRPISHPQRPRIALFTGGGSNPGMELTAKRWPLECFRELAQKLISTSGVQILLIGGPGDVALNQRLSADLHAP